MRSFTKFFILLLCFFSFNLAATAGDTIRVTHTTYIFLKIIATPNKQFSIDWGDAIETLTGTGELQSFNDPNISGKYNVVISGTEDCFFSFLRCEADTVDLSRCSSITIFRNIDAYLQSLDASNCRQLSKVSVVRNKLITLNLRDCPVTELFCCDNKLSHIDLGDNHTLEGIDCEENKLNLSYLYTFSELIEDPFCKVLGRQELLPHRIAVGDSVDFSSQKEFGGIQTVFYVEKGGIAPPDTYTMRDGVITFHTAGAYRVIMTNAAIVSHPQRPAIVIAPVSVIDVIPVAEITKIPTVATEGVSLTLTGTVLPSNATYKSIAFSIKDAGTTGATILASRILQTTAPGTVVVTGTIKDGIAIGTDYTQDFTITVNGVGIEELPVTNYELWVYPNPTNGQLTIDNGELAINSVEICDVYGRKLKVENRRQNVVDISDLPAGIYFVKISTEAGDVVRKVVKQ